MAELAINSEEAPGILKEIDEGAMELVFQAIQEDMYSYPIRSFVREAISNGLDAIVERDVFEAIQSGQPVDKYYLQRQDGKLLKDSSFNADYYDPQYLSNDTKVRVTYKDGTPRGQISIKDYGVGLGGERLKGFFKLGYSSKRNMKDVIGKFGAGAKAGLATGVDYFVMNTTYNGFKTSFMIFKNDYEAITVQRETGKSETWKVKMSDGTIHDKQIFWEPTTEKNGVEIVLEVKKHNAKAFIAAVKDQFQYFGGRVVLEYDSDSGAKVDTLDETPLYESDTLLIPQYSTYTTPHILVDGISYGVISWDELELETRRGKVAIKVAATDVDITQSRESLKWTEKTKKVILNAIKLAEEEATQHITDLLGVSNEENLFKLNDTYNGFTGDNPVSAVFSKFLNMYNLKPKYLVELPSMKSAVKVTMNNSLFTALFDGFNVRKVTLNYDSNKTSIRTAHLDSFESIAGLKIVYAETSSLGPKLAEHIMNKEFDVSSFIYVRPKATFDKTSTKIGGKECNVKEIIPFSSGLFTKYADLQLDEYNYTYEEEPDVELDNAVVSTVESLAKMRKANKEVLYSFYEDVEIDPGNSWSQYQYTSKYCKKTVKIEDLKDHFEGHNVVITTGKYKNLGKIVEAIDLITKPKNKTTIIYISQENVKYFLPYGTLITDYFRQVNLNTGELMIGEHIRNFNTLRKFREELDKYPSFSSNISILSALTSVEASKVERLNTNSKSYGIRYILENSYKIDSNVLDDIFGYLDGLTEFQHVVKSGNKEEINSKASELFNSDKIHHVDAYDEDFINTLAEELERISVIEPLLSIIPEYTTFSVETKELLNLLITTKQSENDHI